VNNNDAGYIPLDEEIVKCRWNKFKGLIEDFIFGNRYDGNNVYVNENILLSIIVKVDQRRKYFNDFHNLDMSEYKEGALHSFWCIKLHPLSACQREFAGNPPRIYDSINEKLALYIILRTLRAMLKKHRLSTKKLDELPAEYLDELVYFFTYRDISKESLIMLVESMAVFLGLDPYVPAKNNRESDKKINA